MPDGAGHSALRTFSEAKAAGRVTNATSRTMNRVPALRIAGLIDLVGGRVAGLIRRSGFAQCRRLPIPGIGRAGPLPTLAQCQAQFMSEMSKYRLFV